VGVTGRVVLTIDELVLDGVEPTDERLRAELARQLREQPAPSVATRAEQLATRVAKAVEVGVRR